MNGPEPRVSVVVPVYNAEKTIGKCLASLQSQDHPSFEIIIVDDASSDATVEICRSYSGTTVLSPGKVGPSKARNLGIDHARGEFVAFTDGDCIADRRWLTGLEQGFDGHGVAGVGGYQKSPEDETPMGRLIHEFLGTVGFMADYVKTDPVMKETEHNPSCTSMYRKSVLQEVGGFHEDLWPGEDVELDLKIRRSGYTLMYNPAAEVAHYRPTTYGSYARMMTRYGRAQGFLVRKYGLFRRIHYEPFVLAVMCIALVSMAAWNPWSLLLGLLPPVGILGWFFIGTGSAGRAMRFALLLSITLACWNWGFVTGYVTGRCSYANL